MSDSSLDHDGGFPDQAKAWIDERVYGGLGSIGRGALEVLGSGFGKGVLVTAAIVTLGILVGAVLAPELVGMSTGLQAAAAINQGLIVAGNTLLSGGGLLALAGGGVVGSLAAAYTENNRIGKDAALAQAEAYRLAREARGKAPALERLAEETPCQDIPGGHCAQLMQQKTGHAAGAAR